jgi:hypothetical protein
VYSRYLRVANETRVSGIVAYISEAEVDDTDEIDVSERCKFSSSLHRFRRGLWILRVASELSGLKRPVETGTSTSAGERTDIMRWSSRWRCMGRCGDV